MVGLLDLAPSTRTVRAGGSDVAVYGVSALGIAALLSQFPALLKMFAGGTLEANPKAIFENAPDAVSALIAAGCGYPGNKDAIKKAESLPVGEQVALVNAILDLTMPQGIGPFVEEVTKLMGRLSLADLGKDPDSNSQLQSKP